MRNGSGHATSSWRIRYDGLFTTGPGRRTVSILEGLTAPQRSAVEHIDGPLLVVAGPGSGKTRVVTRRTRTWSTADFPAEHPGDHLHKQGGSRNEGAGGNAPPRIECLGQHVPQVLCPHAAAVRADRRTELQLHDPRRPGSEAGDAERRRGILGIDPVTYPPDKLGYRISNLKNDLVTADEYREKYLNSIGDHWQAILSKVYPAYQKYLLEANSVDFDDLLLHVAKMLTDHEEIRSQLDARYRYILVDEYQDTNAAQYRIVQALSQRTPTCVRREIPTSRSTGGGGPDRQHPSL